MAHALLSASGAERWMKCTASARLEEGLPSNSSVYANEGTLAHDIARLSLLLATKAITKRTYNSRLKKLQEHELFYKGMPDEVDEYVSYCMETYHALVAQDPLTKMYIEQRLDFSRFVPEGFGTGDCVIIANNTMHIIDLKFGKGVPVYPKDNPQLMLYAIGALEDLGFMYDVNRVVMTIAQVRLSNITSWEIPYADLYEWAEKTVKPLAIEAAKGGADPIAGEHCKWCKFRFQCKARAEYNQEIYKKYEDRKHSEMTVGEIAEILERAKDMVEWVKEIEEFALNQALSGVCYPGWKLVEGRSNRRIIEEEKAAQVLIDRGYTEDEVFKPKTIQTITVLEKLLGKKEFAEVLTDYVEKPPGKPVLVVESDKRPAIAGVESDFDFIN